MTIKGTIDKVFYNKNDFMTGTFVPDSIIDIPSDVMNSKRYKKEAFKFSGQHLMGNSNLENTRVKLSGEWKLDKKYGWGYACQMIDIEATNDVYFFLVKFISGIGEQLASHLVKQFGNDRLIDIIENRPKELLSIKGIGPVLFGRIMTSWNRFAQVRELSSILAPAGCTATMIYKVFRHFEGMPDLIDKIKENPYLLIDVPTISFIKADTVAINRGIDPMSPLRIKAAIVFCVEHHANMYGHTYCDIWEIQKFLKTELEIHINPENIEAEFKALFDGKKLVDIGDQYVMLRTLFDAETLIYNFTTERSGVELEPVISPKLLESFIKGLETSQGFEYNQEQRQALYAANTKLFHIIAGVAGGGKTTVAHGMLKLLGNKYADSNFCVTALSGIATDRIRKTTGYTGATIQSLLVKHKDVEFLQYDVLIIDETSMIPSILLAQLLEKVAPNCIVIMIGDPAQLDPVGPGSAFHDLVSLSSVSKTLLTQPNRQSAQSAIISVANDIRNGVFPNDIDSGREFKMVYKAIKDYPRLKRTQTEEQLRALREEAYESIRREFCGHFSTLKAKMREDISSRNFEAFLFDNQLITPQKVGPLGSRLFNKVLKETVNHLPAIINGADGNDISPFDKVVHTTNMDMPYMSFDDYNKDPLKFNPNNQTRVFNGFIGVVLFSDKEQELVWVYYPLDEKVVIYEFNDVKAFLELAFAITVHKSQGSEYKNVFIPMNLVFYRMLTSRLIYTAVTRAKERCFMVGDAYALQVAVDNIDASSRFTYLQMLLKGNV